MRAVACLKRVRRPRNGIARIEATAKEKYHAPFDNANQDRRHHDNRRFRFGRINHKFGADSRVADGEISNEP